MINTKPQENIKLKTGKTSFVNSHGTYAANSNIELIFFVLACRIVKWPIIIRNPRRHITLTLRLPTWFSQIACL